MIGILGDTSQDLQLLATETLANLAKFKRARRVVRKHGGIPKLVDLLDVDTERYIDDAEDIKEPEELEEEEQTRHKDDDSDLTLAIKVARGAAHALWALSKSKRNKAVIKRAGGLPLLAKLVKMRYSTSSSLQSLQYNCMKLSLSYLDTFQYLYRSSEPFKNVPLKRPIA